MAALRVTKKTWLPILVATLVSLPMISMMQQSARADFVPAPPDDSGQSDSHRAGSTR